MHGNYRTLLKWSFTVTLMSGLVWWACAPIRQARQEQLNNQLVLAAGLLDENKVNQLLNQGADPNACGDPEAQYKGEPQVEAPASQGPWKILLDLLHGRHLHTETNTYNGPRFPVLLIALGLGISDDGDCYHILTNPVTGKDERGSHAQTNIVKALIKRGANTKVRGRYGETPLTVAIMAGNPECITLFLEKGVDVNTLERYRETPLHMASCMHDAHTIRELLRRGANINAQNEVGWTPSMVGKYSTVEEMQALLSGHPDLSLRNKEGETALSLAKKFKKKEIVRLLIEAGARE